MHQPNPINVSRFDSVVVASRKKAPHQFDRIASLTLGCGYVLMFYIISRINDDVVNDAWRVQANPCQSIDLFWIAFRMQESPRWLFTMNASI